MLRCGLVNRSRGCCLLRISLGAKERRRVHYRLTGVKYPVGNSLGCNFPHSGPSNDVYLRTQAMRFIRPISGRVVRLATPMPRNGL